MVQFVSDFFTCLICSQEEENINEPDSDCALIGAHNFAKTNHKLTDTYSHCKEII